MLGEATAAAWRSAVASLCAGFAAAMAVLSRFLPAPIRPKPTAGARSGPEPTPPTTSGSPTRARPSRPTATCSPTACACAPRPASANTATPASATRKEQSFSAQTGVCRCARRLPRPRSGPLTAKAFVGISAIEHDVRPHDPQNPVQGRAYGPKAVVELWLNMGESTWSSLDAGWTSAHADLCRPPPHRLSPVRRRLARYRGARQRQRARQGCARRSVRPLRLARRRDLARRRPCRALLRGRERHARPLRDAVLATAVLSPSTARKLAAQVAERTEKNTESAARVQPSPGWIETLVPCAKHCLDAATMPCKQNDHSFCFETRP